MRKGTVTVCVFLLLSLIPLMMLNSVVALDFDGDGVDDSEDDCSPDGEYEWVSDNSTDFDGDGCRDASEDDDDDNDGVLDGSDNCPQTDLGKSVDSDGCADNQLDSDEDGLNDEDDDCPYDNGNSTMDLLACPDLDGDGWSNFNDEFPDDGTQWNDTDGDGWGDNPPPANNPDWCPTQPGEDNGCNNETEGTPPVWTIDSLSITSMANGALELSWGYSGTVAEMDFVRVFLGPIGDVGELMDQISASSFAYIIDGTVFSHGTYYNITLHACNSYGCNSQYASSIGFADKEVDPMPSVASNPTWTLVHWLNPLQDGFVYEVEWEVSGDDSDVDHWVLCAGYYGNIACFTTVSQQPYLIIDVEWIINGSLESQFSDDVALYIIVPADSVGNSNQDINDASIPLLSVSFDQDSDGILDLEDDCPFTEGYSTQDSIGCYDDDGDGYSDYGDEFPYDATQWIDSDGDGFGDNMEGNNPDNCPWDPGFEYGCPEESDMDGSLEESVDMEHSSGSLLLFYGVIGISVVFIVLAITVVLIKRGRKKSEPMPQRFSSNPPMQYGAPVQRQQIAPPAPVPAPLPPLQVPAPIPAPAPVPLTLQQRFAVAEMLAEGGMAEVYRATEKSTGQVMVWKQAHGKHNPLSVSNMKLEEEAELMKTIPHSRIPQYITHGKITDNSGKEKVVMVQEFIEGGDLKNTVDQLMKVGAVVPLEKIIEYLLAICEPLEHMTNMSEPIYHRDLKPHNVIIHPTRGPVLIDFGLAKMVASGEDMSVTRGGSGTWTPPERDSGISGPFTDVWSLGKIMFYLCTNQKPAAILAEVDMQEVYAKGHPKWVGELILKAVNPRYQDRVESVAWFKYLLNARGNWEKMGSEQAASSDDFTTWG